MVWIRELNWTLGNIASTTTTTEQSEKHKIITIFEKLFKTNRTIEDTENKVQLKPGHPPIKQKARPIPYHLHSYVEKVINRLIESGHREKKQNLETVRIPSSNNREES